MFIAMNRFRVKKGSEDAFEKVWLGRELYLDRILSPIGTFECKPCGLTVTAAGMTGSHALIEKRYFS
jgi:hypothetical protein